MMLADLLERASQDARESPYGYIPSQASTIAFTVVFSILTLAHLFLAIKYRYWAAIATMVVGGFLEILGWVGRLWSSQNVLLWDPFLMQICCLIIGPVFFSAWDYTLLGACITRLGPQYSLLGAKWYLIVFVIADIISLVLQAIGGGGAAVNAQNGTSTTNATHIMLSGILFQLATTTIFVFFAADFMTRVVLDKPYSARVRVNIFKKKQPTTESMAMKALEEGTTESNNTAIPGAGASDPWLRRTQLLLGGVAWATIMIYIRGIYRSIELAQGWTGYLITHEVYFVWLDGFVMVLCMTGLLVAHPGWLLPKRAGWARAGVN